MRDARRIAIKLSEIRNHGVDDPGVSPRRRVIVEVNRLGSHAISPVYWKLSSDTKPRGSITRTDNNTHRPQDLRGERSSFQLRYVKCEFIRGSGKSGLHDHPT